MSDEIIQGDWDDLISRHDLRGRRVRVIVLDQPRSTAVSATATTPVSASEPANPWIANLFAWADSHKPLTNTIDDSRESIYTATTDDPR